MGESNPLGKIPVDQACEETVNRDTKTPGGTIGLSLRPHAVSKYYLVAEYRCIFMRNLKDMLQLNTLRCLHIDLQKTRIYWDESDVKSLLSMLDSWINPFAIEKHDLVCLSTGKMATEQIEKDLRNIGERAYHCFSQQRLGSNPAKEKFFDAMKKVNPIKWKSKRELQTKS